MVAIILILIPVGVSYGSNHCVTIDGIEYCRDIDVKEPPTVVIGDVELKIIDPSALFDKAAVNQLNPLTKISLWENYAHPPFIVELAKQNGMDATTLIHLLAKQDVDPNPWKALSELEELYPVIIKEYGYEVHTALNIVIGYIVRDTLEQITSGAE